MWLKFVLLSSQLLSGRLIEHFHVINIRVVAFLHSWTHRIAAKVYPATKYHNQ